MSGGFFSELKRRNVYRAALLYAAGAWLLLQVAGQVLPIFEIAGWVKRWLLIALVIGFPFWLAFAWQVRGDRPLAQKRWAALPASAHGRRIDLIGFAWLGERESANAIAAQLDAQTFGAVALAEITRHCYCGAPFDLDRTSNFKVRLAEAGFSWPPKKPVPTPLKDW